MNNKYNNSVIYIIKCKNETIKDCYIGSTINFKNRKSCHKSRCYNENSKLFNLKVYKFIRDNGGWNNFEIKEMITHNCNNKEELLKLEGEYIKSYKPSLNNRIAGRTKKEYKKEYIENNKDKIKKYNKEYNKEYREKNKDKIKEKDKQYRENNKDKIKEKITCECGSIVNKSVFARHKKSKKHITYIENNI